MRLTTGLFAFALVLSLTGCASSPFMQRVPRAPIRVDDARATVVFLRPSSVAPDTLVTILDEEGHVLGDSLSGGAFVAKVPPGKHFFVAWSTSTAGLSAELEAGKVYYVEVVVRLGALSSRAHLFAVHNTRKDTANLARWFSESRTYELNLERMRRWMLKREHQARDRVRRAREIFFRLGAGEKKRRSLRVDDGRTE